MVERLGKVVGVRGSGGWKRGGKWEVEEKRRGREGEGKGKNEGIRNG